MADAPPTPPPAPPSMGSISVDGKNVTITPMQPIQLPAVKIETYVPKVTKPKKKFWIGTLPGGPFQNLNIGGCEFVGFTDKREKNPSNDLLNWSPKAGIIVELDDDQVQSILKNCTRKIIREYGVENGSGVVVRRAHQLLADSPNYVGNSEQDRPAGAYVYMVQIANEQDQPSLANFCKPLDDGVPISWSKTSHFHMDKFPPPIITLLPSGKKAEERREPARAR